MRIGTGIGIPFNLGTPLESFIRGLFTANERGTWYDPSDLSTLYQDSAGTTPVTAVEQPVGLMLDKSKGLVLGPELVTANYTTQATYDNVTTSISASSFSTTAGNGAQTRVYLNLTTVAGKTYKVLFSSAVGAQLGVFARDGVGGTGTVIASITSSVGGNTIVFTAASSTSCLLFAANPAQAFSVSGISVRELPGNHAYQTTTTSRPVLSARYNLLIKTEQFDDAAWAKAANTFVQASASVSPRGSQDASLWYRGATSASYIVQSQSKAASAITYTKTIYVKKSVGSYASLRIMGTYPARVDAIYNLDTSSVQSSTAVTFTGVSASIVDAGNGWKRISVTGTSDTASTVSSYVSFSSNGVQVDGADSASNSAGFIWGASLVHANQASLPYQRVNTATDYDTVGFKPYLKFDGVDDFLQTNSIDFTSTDKMHVCAGVRKLSDATGIIAELSATKATNNGAFTAYVDAGTTAYAWYSKGTSETGVLSSALTAPITNIFTGISSISTPNAALRVNGTQVAQSTGTQGTGNYGNYPLYIGRRGGTTLPFNGQLYGLIIRGAASTDAQIAATERYVNNKTGAY